jgi:hypothetical protein
MPSIDDDIGVWTYKRERATDGNKGTAISV